MDHGGEARMKGTGKEKKNGRMDERRDDYKGDSGLCRARVTGSISGNPPAIAKINLFNRATCLHPS